MERTLTHSLITSRKLCNLFSTTPPSRPQKRDGSGRAEGTQGLRCRAWQAVRRELCPQDRQQTARGGGGGDGEQQLGIWGLTASPDQFRCSRNRAI